MKNMDYRLILDSLYEGVYIVDKDRKIIYWNQGARRITGYSSEETIGKYCHDNILNHIDVYGRQLCLDGCPLRETLNDGLARDLDSYLQHKRGHRIPVKLKALPLYEDGIIVGTIEVFTENVDSFSNYNKFEMFPNASLKDALTGLPNRRYFEHFLNAKMNDYRVLDIPFGVALIDIDNFEGINNTYGLKLSDDLLRLLADSYRHSIRLADMIGRWQNDEFVFIFSGVSNRSLEHVCDKIRVLSEGSSLRTSEFSDIDITVSVGASVVRKDDTVDKIINRVSERLKKAKSKGGNTCITK
ncbi:GGDEF domain-containing protein [Fusibacter bizertensis]